VKGSSGIATESNSALPLAVIQSWRTPALDEYFVKSSLLGTHSFFMICVPMPFWFGHADIGRGYVPIPCVPTVFH
jgi:hypothetical protein